MVSKELKHYRHEVHCYLDVLWLIAPDKSKARKLWYKYLALQMNKKVENTHVSKFTIDECKQALSILKIKYKQLTGRKNISKSIKSQLFYNKYGKYDLEVIKKVTRRIYDGK